MPNINMGVEYSEIFRNSIYWTAVPFSNSQPLNFFENCSLCSSKGKCASSNNECGRSINKPNGFSIKQLEKTGNNDSEVLVIVPHKVRLSVVLQHNTYNHKGNHHYVIIAPILSVNKKGKSPQGLQRLYDNLLPTQEYIGEHTGHKAYVNISDIRRVHKSLLIQKFNNSPLNDDTMTSICNKFTDLLDVKQISACKTCKMNCENCPLKAEVVNK